MRYFVLLVCLCVISCKEIATVQVLKGSALGTTYSIKYFSDETVRPAEIDSILQVINTSMSTYQDDSDISKINSGDTTVKVDDHFQTVFEASEAVYKETDGYFDPSVGLLVNAYGFGPGGYSKDVTDAEIDSLYQFVGLNNIHLTEDNYIKFDTGVPYLDFNAIAKGYTVDVFADFLESKGSDNYLVEIGGEVRVKGQNADNQSPWKIGIELPLEDGTRKLIYGVNLYDQSLATSGNYRKYRVDSETGQKFVHTINPKTGKSQKTDILSASVVANDCTTADAYATAFMAMGFKKSMDYLKTNEDLEVIFIYSGTDGVQETFISDSLQEDVDQL
jgi:thiamine biosynthesis lipoprotein